MMHPLLNNQRIAVMRGGYSSEREVSLESGAAVLKTLLAAGYSALDMVVERNPRDVLAQLDSLKPTLVFNALHGTGGEDGAIQGLLTLADVACTHSGIAASAAAMDKVLTKHLLRDAGIYSAPWAVLHAWQEALPLPLPFVLKPTADGSSTGVYIINTAAEWQEHQAISGAWLCEAYIPGKELSVPILGGEALPVIEIIPPTGFYDYDSKYNPANHADFVIPAEVPQNIETQAKHDALVAHQILGCRGVSRSDFRYNPDAPAGQQLVFLEINTQPGMTDLSLTPASASHQGLSFLAVIEQILLAALPIKKEL